MQAWLGIGLARLELARLKAIAKPGPLQPIGSSYARGAAESFMRLLKLDSASAAAALHLSDALDLMPAWVPYTQARDALRRTAATPVDRLPPVLLSRARLERETDVRDSTVVLLQRYLAAGGDSAVAELELAREYYARAETAEGAAAYALGATHAGVSVEGRNAYRAHLALLATPAELARFDSLPPDSLGGWIEGFWSKRDAGVGRPAGARLMEHFRRYEYAFQNFRAVVRRPPGTPSIETLTADVPTGAPDSIDEAMALGWMFGDSAGGARSSRSIVSRGRTSSMRGGRFTSVMARPTIASALGGSTAAAGATCTSGSSPPWQRFPELSATTTRGTASRRPRGWSSCKVPS